MTSTIIKELLSNTTKNIKLIKSSDTIFHFDLDSVPVKVITDFEHYCMAESPLNIYDLNMFNMMMTIQDKNPEIIIQELLNILISTSQNIEKLQFKDPFHIYQKIDEFTKISIDYKTFEKNLESYSQKIVSNVKIPKNLLLSKSQIISLILNEIKKVNRNKSYDHYIVPDNINPYVLHLFFVFKGVESKIEMKLILDPNAYPYMPPKLEHSKPAIKMPLLLSLMNLDILKLENWNFTVDLEYFVSNLGSQLEPIIQDYLCSENNMFQELEYMLIKLASITKETHLDKPLISIPVPKPKTTAIIDMSGNKFWKSGTGYGAEGIKEWNIKNYIQEQELIMDELSNCLTIINSMITHENFHIINDSILTSYIIKQIKGLNILELEKNKKLWGSVFNILTAFVGNNMSQNIINMIALGLKNLYEELNVVVETKEINDNTYILQIYCLIDYYMSKYIEPMKPLVIATTIKEEYCMAMKKLQFGSQELYSTHRYFKNKTIKPEQKSVMRMLSEISSFKNNLPLNWESSIWVRVPKDNFNLFTFMISGPKDTPYENGLFEFHAYLPPSYPNEVPQVLLHTTGNDTIRFNPNLYNSGKVCLSLLGTWQGQESEKWNAKTSTFLQVLVSIQSLILVEQPFFNEPGYERDINTPQGKKRSDEYNEEKEPHTINLAMINMIRNPPKGYEDVVATHFRMKKDEIIAKTLIWEQRATKHVQLISNYRKELLKLLNSI
jgi:ubiquitin-protein ligase